MMTSLNGGPASYSSYISTYKRSGTIHAITSLLAQSAAMTDWRLYKKAKQDGRQRYTTGDKGSDQRTEVLKHPSTALWDKPNPWHTGMEFREGSNLHLELTGMTFWVLDRENAMRWPTSIWYVRPDRMSPIPDPEKFLAGWLYTGPNGEQVPLLADEVIVEKLPDPEDPFMGCGPISSIMANIEQQDYATQYQRNTFRNGAFPSGMIEAPAGVNMLDRDIDEIIARFREGNGGLARAGKVGFLENGLTFNSVSPTNRDMEYGNLRLANRDEERESFRMHKHMLGTVDDVNRANAATAEDTFTSWQTIPRLVRRRDTLNFKLLPMFGDGNVEFDYDDPSQISQETADAELTAKSAAAAALIGAGFDPHDVLEAVGLPDMDVAETATQEPALPPGWVPAPPALPSAAPGAAAIEPPPDPNDISNYLKHLASLNGHAYAGGRH
jgi:HK97 family phage portal protein